MEQMINSHDKTESVYADTNGNLFHLYTITLNERTSTGKALLDLIRSLGIIAKPVRSTNTSKSTTLNAIREAKAGEGTLCEDFEDYLRKVHE